MLGAQLFAIHVFMFFAIAFAQIQPANQSLFWEACAIATGYVTWDEWKAARLPPPVDPNTPGDNAADPSAAACDQATPC
jgi:hypothetical protein